MTWSIWFSLKISSFYRKHPTLTNMVKEEAIAAAGVFEFANSSFITSVREDP